MPGVSSEMPCNETRNEALNRKSGEIEMREWILLFSMAFLHAAKTPAEAAIHSIHSGGAFRAGIPAGGRSDGLIERGSRRIHGFRTASKTTVLRLRRIERQGLNARTTLPAQPGPADFATLGQLKYLTDARANSDGFLRSVQRYGASLLLLVIAGGVVYLVYTTARSDVRKMNRPMEIVRLRYAKGEITNDEYSIMKKELEWRKSKRLGFTRTVFLEPGRTRSESLFTEFAEGSGRRDDRPGTAGGGIFRKTRPIASPENIARVKASLSEQKWNMQAAKGGDSFSR
jgi:hypothetical protein